MAKEDHHNNQLPSISAEQYQKSKIQCFRCSLLIYPEEYAFRIPQISMTECYYYFHLKCFTCIICNCQLKKGQLYGLKGYGEIYCAKHYYSSSTTRTRSVASINHIESTSSECCVCKSDNNHDYTRHPEHSLDFDDASRSVVAHHLDAGALNETLHLMASTKNTKMVNTVSKEILNDITKDEQQEQHGTRWLETSTKNIYMEMSKSSTVDDDPHHHQSSAVKILTMKRIRTTFKKFQLDLLRKCFKKTHKPNQMELNLLVKGTGLSRRVLQIWFQNQRSKWCRYVMSKPKCGPIKCLECSTMDQLFCYDLVLVEHDLTNSITTTTRQQQQE